MANLNTEFFNFFMDLAPNNNKDWFDQNRKRYKTFVKDPFADSPKNTPVFNLFFLISEGNFLIKSGINY